MSLLTRLQAAEARLRELRERKHERETAAAPPCWQRADRDEDGNVIACERMVFPRNPPNVDTLGPLAAAFTAMTREPLTRASCPYTECENRDTCRADGSLTRWGMNP